MDNMISKFSLVILLLPLSLILFSCSYSDDDDDNYLTPVSPSTSLQETDIKESAIVFPGNNSDSDQSNTLFII